MIITKQKEFDEILDYLKNAKRVFLVGCTLCATTCKTGGENEMKNLEEALKKAGKEVTGWAIPDPTCSILEVKRLYRNKNKEIESADAILSFACGGGTQTLGDVIKGIDVFPGNDTLFQGEITSITLKEARFDQKCSLCGECILAMTGSICPVTLCPKGLVNGPCGGVKNNKCEIDSDLDCAWLVIYNKLKERGRISDLKEIKAPKDHSKNKKPQKRVVNSCIPRSKDRGLS